MHVCVSEFDVVSRRQSFRVYGTSCFRCFGPRSGVFGIFSCFVTETSSGIRSLRCSYRYLIGRSGGVFTWVGVGMGGAN